MVMRQGWSNILHWGRHCNGIACIKGRVVGGRVLFFADQARILSDVVSAIAFSLGGFFLICGTDSGVLEVFSVEGLVGVGRRRLFKERAMSFFVNPNKISCLGGLVLVCSGIFNGLIGLDDLHGFFRITFCLGKIQFAASDISTGFFHLKTALTLTLCNFNCWFYDCHKKLLLPKSVFSKINSKKKIIIVAVC